MIGRSAWPKVQPYVWPEIPSKEGKLYVLTEKSFRGHVSRGDHFVMMYAPWCGHCQQLKPVWEQLAKSQVSGVKISKIDCTANQEICKSFLVHGYPTLLYFRNGENLGKYDGDKSLNGLKKHIKKMTNKSDGKKGKGAKSKPSPEL
ncbi:thioredoxin domain-containing protein 5 [Eurytemora carolleeae]|uniref:thioredoxin domain-containing protein 5 n=1 Tax=Eurytemora carolleeae TaxID=1294199 RepID=UPI000C791599|nr:thioredoxin domain-containing protein 5 [Eurytemora carolleeae]|eukprot:XP_023324566.1 thioredoxin domain-containing protein 5-like [Eurytemora affinis]